MGLVVAGGGLWRVMVVGSWWEVTRGGKLIVCWLVDDGRCSLGDCLVFMEKCLCKTVVYENC